MQAKRKYSKSYFQGKLKNKYNLNYIYLIVCDDIFYTQTEIFGEIVFNKCCLQKLPNKVQRNATPNPVAFSPYNNNKGTL